MRVGPEWYRTLNSGVLQQLLIQLLDPDLFGRFFHLPMYYSDNLQTTEEKDKGP